MGYTPELSAPEPLTGESAHRRVVPAPVNPPPVTLPNSQPAYVRLARR